MPAWWRTPAEANINIIQTIVIPPPPAAVIIMDLLTKPLKRGKPEMDAAPIIQNIVVSGMVLYNPPRSVHLIFPV